MELFGHPLPHTPGHPALVSGSGSWDVDALRREADAHREGRGDGERRLGGEPAGVPTGPPPRGIRMLAGTPDAEGILALLSAWQAGQVAAPLGSGLTSAERARAEAALRNAEAAGTVPAGTAAILWTSGTSGDPRGVALTGKALARHAMATRDRLELVSDDVWYASLSPAHVGGLALVTRALLLGSTLVADGPFRAERLAAALRGEGPGPAVTHASLVPTQLRRLLETWGDGPPPATLRCLLLGGAATPDPLLRRALETGWPVALTYGMTEMCSQVATAPPAQVRQKPGCVGRPLEGVELRIAEDGEILLRGPGLAAGLVGTDAPLTTPEGWYPSGDLGRVDDDGDLWIEGRKSDRVITGGVTVDPHEVEAVLRTHPRVRDACVVGIPDPEWGERLAALVVPKPPSGAHDGDPQGTLGRVREWAAERLGPARLPRLWRVSPDLPLNANGKVDRPRVRALLANPGDLA